MLKKIIITAILFSLPSYARADQDLGKVRTQIIEQYAAMNYCDKPKPTGRPGEIIIFWTRDVHGKCVVQNYEILKMERTPDATRTGH